MAQNGPRLSDLLASEPSQNPLLDQGPPDMGSSQLGAVGRGAIWEFL